MELPVYELLITAEDNGINKVSLVKKPAIMSNFVAFNKDEANPHSIKFEIADADKRIVTGAVLIPDQLIYRVVDGTEFNVMLSASTIKQASIKLMKGGATQVNTDHSEDVEGVIMFEQFISDTSRGIVAPEAFKDLPDGTLYQSFYVDNDDVWSKVKDGTFQGFSIEGLFDMNRIDTPAEFGEVVEIVAIDKELGLSEVQSEALVNFAKAILGLK